MMLARTWPSLSSAGAGRWNELAGEPSPWLRSGWLNVAHEGLGVPTRYVIAEREGEAVAATPVHIVDEADAVYSFYDVPRTAAAEASADGRFASLYPCLIVSSLGLTSGIAYRPDLTAPQRESAARAVFDRLDELVQERAAKTIAALYVTGADETTIAEARRRGYAIEPMGADCVLPVAWPSFDGYLASRGKSRRSAIRRELRRVARAGVVIERAGAQVLSPELADLHAATRAKYGHPDSRDVVRSLFHRLAAFMSESVRVFVARRETRIVGFTVFLECDGHLHGRYVGFDYERLGAVPLYFVLAYYEPIAFAAEHGLVAVHFGDESYDAKLSRGCELEPMYALYRLAGDDAPAALEALRSLGSGKAAQLAALSAGLTETCSRESCGCGGA